jgi:hypothetical protein
MLQIIEQMRRQREDVAPETPIRDIVAESLNPIELLINALTGASLAQGGARTTGRMMGNILKSQRGSLRPITDFELTRLRLANEALERQMKELGKIKDPFKRAQAVTDIDALVKEVDQLERLALPSRTSMPPGLNPLRTSAQKPKPRPQAPKPGPQTFQNLTGQTGKGTQEGLENLARELLPGFQEFKDIEGLPEATTMAEALADKAAQALFRAGGRLDPKQFLGRGDLFQIMGKTPTIQERAFMVRLMEAIGAKDPLTEARSLRTTIERILPAETKTSLDKMIESLIGRPPKPKPIPKAKSGGPATTKADIDALKAEIAREEMTKEMGTEGLELLRSVGRQAEEEREGRIMQDVLDAIRRGK